MLLLPVDYCRCALAAPEIRMHQRDKLAHAADEDDGQLSSVLLLREPALNYTNKIQARQTRASEVFMEKYLVYYNEIHRELLVFVFSLNEIVKCNLCDSGLEFLKSFKFKN